MLSFLSPLVLVGCGRGRGPNRAAPAQAGTGTTVQFAAVKLLKTAPVEYTDTRRIREWLLLALRVAALVCLAVAFARPFLASGAAWLRRV